MSKLDELIKKLHDAKDMLQKRAPEGIDPKKHESCVMDLKEQGHDVGSAHAVCSASMKKDDNGCQPELIKYSSNGQWNLSKDNSVKPFGQSVYDATANLNRKATRTGEERPEMGRNQGVRQYTTMGSSMQQAHEKLQAKLAKLTPEQREKREKKINAKQAAKEAATAAAEAAKAAIKPKTVLRKPVAEQPAEAPAVKEAPFKKGIDVAKEALTTGNLPILQDAGPQPTNERLFGHLVVSPEAMKKAEERYQGGNQRVVQELSKPVDQLNKSTVKANWNYGKSFNSILKDEISEKEMLERNAYIGE